MNSAHTAIVHTLTTPDGPFTLIAHERGEVLASGWTADRYAVLVRIPPALRPGTVRQGRPDAADAVAAYYDGDLGAVLVVPVSQHGTALQRQGWETLRRIPAGAPLTYAEFAAALDRPSAVRAAASICARNAPALFVPCHRVLRGDGSMGGFAWGTDVKRALLAREA